MSDIGHNSAAMSPFEAASVAVETVWIEAQHWLDGATVATQAEADAIGQLLDMARKAAKAADEARVEEKRPHDDAAKAVQARYKPLLDRCERVSTAAKAALAPFLKAQEAAKREAERIAREKAEAAAEAARAAFAASQPSDLAAREAADALAEKARRAEIAAAKAAKDGGRAKGGARAIGLRSVKVAHVADLRAALAWVWENDRAALMGFMQSYADGALRAGQQLPPGVDTVFEERVA